MEKLLLLACVGAFFSLITVQTDGKEPPCQRSSVSDELLLKFIKLNERTIEQQQQQTEKQQQQSEKQQKQIEKQRQQIETLTKSLQEVQLVAKSQTLENSILKSKLSSLMKSGGVVNNTIADLAETAKEMKKNLASVTGVVQNSIADPKWPTGRYCILANGKCPKGFQQISGGIQAIRVYTSAGCVNVKPVQFGSSFIRHHRNCHSPDYPADIGITACCK